MADVFNGMPAVDSVTGALLATQVTATGTPVFNGQPAVDSGTGAVLITLVAAGGGGPVVGSPYEIDAGYAGVSPPPVMTASQILVSRVAPYPITFPANFAGSFLTLFTQATAAMTFTIASAGTTIGSVAVAADGKTGVFTSTGGTPKAVAAGSLITLLAPSAVDITAAGPVATLIGSIT